MNAIVDQSALPTLIKEGGKELKKKLKEASKNGYKLHSAIIRDGEVVYRMQKNPNQQH